jgi:hypothetical protein
MNCIPKNELIDSILNSYLKDLGTCFDQYRNHVYRVYNFSVPHVNGERDIKILSIASAFHDVGIWTHHTFDYLEHSIALAKKYSKAHKIDAEAILEIETIINEHHKLTRVKTSKLAEIFRQADMVDLTWGWIRNGRDKKDITMIQKAFPNKRFHVTLTKLFLVNLLQHPLRPFPMYKL